MATVAPNILDTSQPKGGRPSIGDSAPPTTMFKHCWFLLLAASSLHAAPPLIPQPQRVVWTANRLECRTFTIDAPAEAAFAAEDLARALAAAGARKDAAGTTFVLKLAKVRAASDESYVLDITTSGVRITAPKPAGLYYGVQTVRQLIRPKANGAALAGCHIDDWPAFAWRGFMHDVGRNFQDIETLKRFVDVMGRYKMNVFHFHLTDNPGYRIECRVHPELNRAASYLPTRRPGKFYTYAELNDFIRYCRQRGLMVVPEIDMPGHSDYFKRAFGCEMQSAKGEKILAECVDEFLQHVDTPYLHLGSDEVQVKSKGFLDRMANLVRSRGRKILVWRPGHLPQGEVVTQLWAAGAKPNTPIPGLGAVDSRHNYINAMDPFDGPVRLLNLAVCGCDKGDDANLGGILCHWPDINAGDAMNVYRQSPVFPALLAASESYWRGGKANHPEYWVRLPTLGDTAIAAYAEFESRMLAHRDAYFADWPFPYVRQTDIPWKLIGVFDHQGKVDAVFPPEKEIREEYELGDRIYAWGGARGATIHVNHFWYGAAWFPKAEQGTVYALTYVRSPRAQKVGFWIGFNGPLRSSRRGIPNPERGQWSTTGSKVWVNDREIPPPAWKQPGKVRDANETPLADEDYFYRDPTPIALQAGWNKILIKAPKGPKAWKWTFTCVPVAVSGNRVREVPDLQFSAWIK